MLEPKDHEQTIDASGALDLTFAEELTAHACERQIRSTGALPATNRRHGMTVMELQLPRNQWRSQGVISGFVQKGRPE
jgi:hypothetical protein